MHLVYNNFYAIFAKNYYIYYILKHIKSCLKITLRRHQKQRAPVSPNVKSDGTLLHFWLDKNVLSFAYNRRSRQPYITIRVGGISF